jgi:fatty acid desaturase
MSIQAYAPFRTSLLSREELRRLSVLRPAVPVLHTIIHWALILGAWAMVAVWPNIFTIAAAFFIVGVNFYGIYILLHDGIHRRLFASTWANDTWNDLFLMGPVGAVTHINRHNHLHHHKVTCLPDDPDRFKYSHDDKEPVMPFMSFLTGLTFAVPAARNVFLNPHTRAEEEQRTERYTGRDIAILATWQIGLLAGLTYFIGWWAYPVLWLAPVYALAYRADIVRVFCEHSMLTGDAEADESMRLITYKSNWFEKLFFAPHNMNYHMAHHLWPNIPYYNLPKADKIIRASEYVQNGDPRLMWRRSYVGYIVSYVKWRLTQRGASVLAAAKP